MYQARRDVVIMQQQLGFSARTADSLTSVATLRRRVLANPCPTLRSAKGFDGGCSVRKAIGTVDCTERPGSSCHVKDAAIHFNRMGDLGKLPTSAWLHFWRNDALPGLLREVARNETDPKARAELLVERLSSVRRVGRKLATMFVSALSVPSLAPGLTPWSPRIDGNDLVVVDTNVARAVDALDHSGAPRTYDTRTRWVREQAERIDLTLFRPDLPKVSPRLVQQAIYAFCSRSVKSLPNFPPPSRLKFPPSQAVMVGVD